MTEFTYSNETQAKIDAIKTELAEFKAEKEEHEQKLADIDAQIEEKQHATAAESDANKQLQLIEEIERLQKLRGILVEKAPVAKENAEERKGVVLEADREFYQFRKKIADDLASEIKDLSREIELRALKIQDLSNEARRKILDTSSDCGLGLIDKHLGSLYMRYSGTNTGLARVYTPKISMLGTSQFLDALHRGQRFHTKNEVK
ncbi:hypothetical protein FLK61_35380 [Paenalkalicoccus suaedae]|uniref:Uncharacterized protein n=1 Tax=Paenalkalicoccus suaedae TaxID=2592382 RepID=A0A859FH22_9BACI|nr:hypothetical protein [Paenalkalicoccus suaedae]QKS71952.1 hypothetical protein FLK61_35380 [Paenalkalicoccus suaedae]